MRVLDLINLLEDLDPQATVYIQESDGGFEDVLTVKQQEDYYPERGNLVIISGLE